MEMVSFYSLIQLVFVVVAIIRQMVAGIELRCTVFFFFVNPNCKVVRLQAMAIPL